jgi:tetratricopeptide (TPR) repeat protein
VNLQRPSARDLLIGLCLSAVVLIVFGRVVGHDFINFDDPDYVTTNPHVAAGLSWDGIVWAFTSFHAGHYHPLTWLSHMTDVSLFGLDASGHHAVSVLLFAVCAVLLQSLLVSWTERPAMSLLFTAAFVLHPFRVESVAWVTGRKDLLSLFFLLAGLRAWATYVRQREPAPHDPRRRGGRAYVVALVCMLLGWWSKPILVVFPFLLLLLDAWPFERTSTRRELLVEKLPFLALALVIAAVSMASQQAASAIVDDSVMSLGQRVLHAAASAWRYIGLMFWPEHLAAFYPLRTTSTTTGVFALLAWAFVLVGVVLLRRVRPELLVGVFWFGICLGPVIGIVQIGGQDIADRYALLPSMGLLIALLFGIRWSPRWRGAFLSAAISILAICGAASYRQAGHWRDSETLWRHALVVTEAGGREGNFMAHLNLGVALEARGASAEASEHYDAAYKLAPHYPPIVINRANSFARAGRHEEAWPLYERALERAPDNALAHYNYGLSLAFRGRWDNAIEHLRATLELDPRHVWAHVSLADGLRRRGDLDEARRLIERAISMQPDHEGALRMRSTLGSTP